MEKEKLTYRDFTFDDLERGRMYCKAWRRHFKSCIVEATAGSER